MKKNPLVLILNCICLFLALLGLFMVHDLLFNMFVLGLAISNFLNIIIRGEALLNSNE